MKRIDMSDCREWKDKASDVRLGGRHSCAFKLQLLQVKDRASSLARALFVFAGLDAKTSFGKGLCKKSYVEVDPLDSKELSCIKRFPKTMKLTDNLVAESPTTPSPDPSRAGGLIEINCPQVD
jgi:hypothetical protein